ncbi:hypothetical protein QUT51_17305, partial [Xanthomonas citri pv. citri]
RSCVSETAPDAPTTGAPLCVNQAINNWHSPAPATHRRLGNALSCHSTLDTGSTNLKYQIELNR